MELVKTISCELFCFMQLYISLKHTTRFLYEKERKDSKGRSSATADSGSDWIVSRSLGVSRTLAPRKGWALGWIES